MLLMSYVGLIVGANKGEDAAESRQIQQVALIGSDDQPYIGHQQHHEELEEVLGAARLDRVAKHKAE